MQVVSGWRGSLSEQPRCGSVIFPRQYATASTLVAFAEVFFPQVEAHRSRACREGPLTITAWGKGAVEHVAQMEEACDCRVLFDDTREDLEILHPIKSCDGLRSCNLS